jgi:hypothetical protein
VLAHRRLRGTVIGVNNLVVAQPNPAGHVAVLRIPTGASIVAVFEDGSEQDLTSWSADLALIGLACQPSGDDPADSVQIAELHLRDAGETSPTMMYVHPGTGTAAEYDWAMTLALIGAGVTAQITRGIEQESTSPDEQPATV